MTVTDQIKILNRKIKQNELQYDLDREAAKISVLSSNNLGKYELLTGEDLGLKPSTAEQAKFDYSPLGKILNKGLSEEDKKQGLLESSKNIENENKVKNKDIIEVPDFVNEPLSFEAKKLINEIKTMQKNVDYRKLNIKGGNNTDYDFSDYRAFNELFRDLYYRKITIDDIEGKQEEFIVVMNVLERYVPRDNKNVEAKNKLLNNAKKIYEGREKNIEGFKNGVFPLYYNENYEQIEAEKERRKQEEQEEQEEQEKQGEQKKTR